MTCQFLLLFSIADKFQIFDQLHSRLGFDQQMLFCFGLCFRLFQISRRISIIAVTIATLVVVFRVVCLFAPFLRVVGLAVVWAIFASSFAEFIAIFLEFATSIVLRIPILRSALFSRF